MPDARVQHGVEDVDEEVHEHVRDRDDRDQALDGDVLAGPDRIEDLLTQSGQSVDALDDDGATDQRADVEPATVRRQADGRSAGARRMRVLLIPCSSPSG